VTATAQSRDAATMGRPTGISGSRRFVSAAPALLVATFEVTQLYIITREMQLLRIGRGLKQEGQSRLSQMQGIAPIPILLLLLVIALMYRVRIRTRLEPLLILAMIGIPAAAVAGVIYSNPYVRIVGDAYELVVFGATYLPLVALMNADMAAAALRKIFNVMMLFAVVEVPMELYFFAALHRPAGFSATVFLAPLFYEVLGPRSTSRRRILIPLYVVGALLTFKRTLYAMLLLGIIALGKKFGWGAVRRTILITVVTVVTLLALENVTGLKVRTTISARIAQEIPSLNGQKKNGPSVEYRVSEARAALRELRTVDEFPPPVLTGYGLGRSVYVSTPFGPQARHTIHNTVIAFVYRTGIVYTFVILMWLLLTVRRIWSSTRAHHDAVGRRYWALAAWSVVYVAAGMVSSYIVWKDYELAAVLAVLVVLATDKRYPSKPATAEPALAR